MLAIPTNPEKTSTTQSTTTPTLSACGHCRRKFSVMHACKKCLVKQYCGQECQTKNWPFHKTVCVKKDPDLWTKICALEKNWKSPESPLGPITANMAEESNRSCKNVKEYWDFFHEQAVNKPYPPHPDLSQYHDEKLENNCEKHCIDLGASLGGNSLFLLQRNWKVTAVDYSKAAIDIISKKANATNDSWLKTEQLILKEQDIVDYEFPEEQVDLIIANEVLPFCNPCQLQPLLKKIHSALKEDGSFQCSFFPEHAPTLASWAMIKNFYIEMGAWLVKDSKVVHSILAESGFDCKVTTSFNYIAKKL